MIVLNGITWDHDRGLLPLLETTKSFHKLYPEIDIRWKKRTLKEFGDFPVEELAKEYDLLLVDHPFSGEAYKHNILIDYNQYMPKEVLQLREEQELGETHKCYNYNGKQLALSVDISAMVSAYRKDLFEAAGRGLPETLEEVIELARDTGQVAAPLGPTDIWCIFLSLGAARFGSDFVTEQGLNMENAVWAIDCIYDLYRVLMPESIDYNPIQIMDRMSRENSILYAPFCFGYVNYAWKNRDNPLNFTDTPLWDNAKRACILGGVGIAVSASSKNIEAAVRYAEYVTRPHIQEYEYFLSGGQPGQKDAWMSDHNNELTGNFFLNTLQTIKRAYLRPRFPGWNVFQEKCCIILNEGVRTGIAAEEIAQTIQELFNKYIGANPGKEGEQCINI
ncbi:ABC transporter substrate-binding protein [Lacrimispora sp.]|uniref:ABC transporter substrate-binding protein n=1 Tax=Lacrimispora sp. TaxID=2719234 RepID=UPI00345FCF4F